MSINEKTLKAELATVIAQRNQLSATIALLIPLHDATGNTALADNARAALEFSAPTVFMPVEPPDLEIDALLYKGSEMHASAKMERRIVANLLAWLEFNGWKVTEIDDGDEETLVSDAKSAMELIFDLDEVRVEVSNAAGNSHRILMILGEGSDLVADYSFTDKDPDGFDAAMKSFQAEDYA
jgi:hypothetical protein